MASMGIGGGGVDPLSHAWKIPGLDVPRARYNACILTTTNLRGYRQPPSLLGDLMQ